MRVVRVINNTRNEVLAERAELATSYWSRFGGLMGRRELPTGCGLVLQPGVGIPMSIMRIPLDVLHVDNYDPLTHVLRGLPPWRFGPLLVGANRAIEPPGGASD